MERRAEVPSIEQHFCDSAFAFPSFQRALGGVDVARHDGDDGVLGVKPPSPAPVSPRVAGRGSPGSAAAPMDSGFPVGLRQGERCVRASSALRVPAHKGDVASTHHGTPAAPSTPG